MVEVTLFDIEAGANSEIGTWDWSVVPEPGMEYDGFCVKWVTPYEGCDDAYNVGVVYA